MINRPLLRAIAGVGLAAVFTGCVPKGADEDIDDADKSTCLAERQSMETAVEAFYALNGVNPASEAELVPMFMRTESASMDLDSNGNVVASPTSNCL